ncbi:RNA polymerase sigma factor [Eggerthella sinensis]|uniref:RNA polymerase sigma factor n=1 Tax=Eggerthella sinensis TaxID=242230 RepID=UPI001D071515|nr:sigma-70 family RNA polymerase sigma factor [Eggerthella sinensis]MCB7037766.1 sigma-70 family RNA polymerase sigma factor [Eggerthella sinensis]
MSPRPYDDASDAERLALRYYDDVYRYCYRHSGSREDAQDATQEVFLRFVRNQHRYADRGKPLAYLLVIARNVCADSFRARRAQVPLDEQTADPRPESCGLELADMISKLPDDEREIVALKYDQGLTTVEIGAVTGLSRFAVARKLKSALADLRHQMTLAERGQR